MGDIVNRLYYCLINIPVFYCNKQFCQIFYLGYLPTGVNISRWAKSFKIPYAPSE